MSSQSENDEDMIENGENENENDEENDEENENENEENEELEQQQDQQNEEEEQEEEHESEEDQENEGETQRERAEWSSIEELINATIHSKHSVLDLECFFLVNNQIEKILSILENYSTIKELRLGHTESFSQRKGFSKLTSLESLKWRTNRISGSVLKDIRQNTSITSVQLLNLDSSFQYKDLLNLCRKPNLKRVELLEYIDSDGCEALSVIEELEHLKIRADPDSEYEPFNNLIASESITSLSIEIDGSPEDFAEQILENGHNYKKIEINSSESIGSYLFFQFYE